jgi:hypothetical protein
MNFLSAFPEEERFIPEEFGGINPTSKKNSSAEIMIQQAQI